MFHSIRLTRQDLEKLKAFRARSCSKNNDFRSAIPIHFATIVDGRHRSPRRRGASIGIPGLIFNGADTKLNGRWTPRWKRLGTTFRSGATGRADNKAHAGGSILSQQAKASPFDRERIINRFGALAEGDPRCLSM